MDVLDTTLRRILPIRRQTSSWADEDMPAQKQAVSHGDAALELAPETVRG